MRQDTEGSRDTRSDAPPRAGRVWARIRTYLTFWNVITVAVLVWAAPRLLPHVGAVLGVDSGPRTTPTYRYVTLDGANIGSEELAGQVVLVNFWATWCAPCRAEMPLLEQMHQRHREAGFVVVGLAVDRVSTEAVRAFVQDRGVTYPIAHVGSEAEQVFGGVRGYPTSFLLDRTGKIRHTVLGAIGPLSLEPAVRRLLAEQ
jgi:cytochrome c biogenesis protein CcmG/thiol:disulfide interchange protein DsbE